MHTKSALSRSVRKYIRCQKAQLRETTSDPKALEEAFGKLYQQFGLKKFPISNS
ncbi:hypothetical protein HZA86_05325 [Candidatus Uhrbacteria bacterium]|nr:hypothetical protein [Candidatus Uhrbacteria bacterium]